MREELLRRFPICQEFILERESASQQLKIAAEEEIAQASPLLVMANYGILFSSRLSLIK